MSNEEFNKEALRVFKEDMVIGIVQLGQGSPLVKTFPDWKKTPEDQTFVTISGKGLEDILILTKRLLDGDSKLRESHSFEYLRQRIIDKLSMIKILLHERSLPEESVEHVDFVNLILSDTDERARTWYFALGLTARLCKEFSICDVKLFSNDNDLFGRLLSAAIEKDYVNSAETSKQPDNKLKSLSFAATRFSACNDDDAKEIAASKVRLALSTMRLSIPDLSIAMSGEYIAFNVDESYILMGPTLKEVTEPFWKISEDAMLKISRDPTIHRVNEILSRTIRTDLEERLLRAIFWYGRAVEHEDRREAVLDSVIGLESLLLKEYQQRKSATIAELAHRLVADSDYESAYTPDMILSICKTRNEIAHRGEMQVSMKEANLAVMILREVILRILRLSTVLEDLDGLRSRTMGTSAEDRKKGTKGVSSVL